MTGVTQRCAVVAVPPAQAALDASPRPPSVSGGTSVE